MQYLLSHLRLTTEERTVSVCATFMSVITSPWCWVLGAPLCWGWRWLVKSAAAASSSKIPGSMVMRVFSLPMVSWPLPLSRRLLIILMCVALLSWMSIPYTPTWNAVRRSWCARSRLDDYKLSWSAVRLGQAKPQTSLSLLCMWHCRRRRHQRCLLASRPRAICWTRTQRRWRSFK